MLWKMGSAEETENSRNWDLPDDLGTRETTQRQQEPRLASWTELGVDRTELRRGRCKPINKWDSLIVIGLGSNGSQLHQRSVARHQSASQSSRAPRYVNEIEMAGYLCFFVRRQMGLLLFLLLLAKVVIHYCCTYS